MLALLKKGHLVAHRGECRPEIGILGGSIPKTLLLTGRSGASYPGTLGVRGFFQGSQCYVEQKNGSVVRKFVGYDRFEGIQPCRILGMLYEPLRLYVNFFQPSLKLLSKKREGSRVIKKYDTAQTPYQRVMADKTVSADSRQALQEQFKRLDPVELLTNVERLQDQLWRYAFVGRRVVSTPISRDGEGHSPLAEHICPHCGSMDAERPTKPFSAVNEGSHAAAILNMATG